MKCAVAGVPFSLRHWTGVSEKRVEDEVYVCCTAWGTVRGERAHDERNATIECCNFFVGEV